METLKTILIVGAGILVILTLIALIYVLVLFWKINQIRRRMQDAVLGFVTFKKAAGVISPFFKNLKSKNGK